MRDFYNIFRTTIITFLIGGLLIYWGAKNDGTVRIILGVIIIGAFTKNAFDNIRYIQDLKIWRQQNNGRLIFFYATTKDLQTVIEEEIFPLLPSNCLKVYYDGPNLVGDIKRSVTVELMNQYKDIQVHSPSIFKVTNDKIIIEKVVDIKDINASLADLNIIKSKIDKIANA
ncbi:MAG: hypothetical protein ACKVTZ_17660 [Bacteroidia bacterium]